MLDDNEFKLVSSLFNTGTEGGTTDRMFGPALHEYERITGFHETNPTALYHHVLSIYGPPCARVRKTAENTKSKALRLVYAPSHP